MVKKEIITIKILYCNKSKKSNLIKGMCLLKVNEDSHNYTWKDLHLFRSRYPFAIKPYIESKSEWVDIVGHVTRSGLIIVDGLLINC